MYGSFIHSRTCISSLGLTSEGYRKEGKWKGNVPEHDEKSTVDKVYKSLGDLIESGGFETAVDEYLDQYEFINFGPNQSIITRCDYYSRLKCYCVRSKPELFKVGVQEILMKFKKNVVISAVAPGNFYSRERKQARIRIEQGYKYEYFLQHKIIHQLTRNEKCTEDINWKTDDCKLGFINQKITKSFNCTTPWLLSYAR